MQDVIIVGAGPIGLALAASLAARGRRVALVERQPAERLAAPAFDGREIAVTHRSRELLAALGVWHRLPADEIHPLLSAQVLNGGSPRTLILNPSARHDSLGTLVSNVHLRRALYEVVERADAIDLVAGEAVGAARIDSRGRAEIELESGRRLHGRVLVAADSRLSALRPMFGIGADIDRLPKTMLLFRVVHAAPHGGIATEWFDHRGTVATLPLAPGLSSVVMTLPHAEAERLAELPDAELARHAQARLGHRLGALDIASTRHRYPLVVSYAHRFAAGRFALVGDAAVGMHPVTAHGFNFGLIGQDRLARTIDGALGSADGQAIARALQLYADAHRRETRPLFLATNALTRLFTRKTPAARLVRHAVIAAGTRTPRARSAIAAFLA